MNVDAFVEEIKSLLRPIKRMINEDILDRLLSHSIKTKRLAAEAEHRVSFNKEGTILFNTQYHWYHSWVDYSIAAALKYRGINGTMFLCDGLPYCEYETNSVKRPSCARCYRLTKRHVDAFGLQSYRLSEFLDKNKKEECYKIAFEKPVSELRYLIRDGVNIGEIAYRNFIHYYKGVFDITKEKENQFRKCLYSGLLISVTTQALVNKIKPSKVITPNGKYIQSAISIDVAKSFKLPYYTWDVFEQKTAASFAKNEVSHNQKIDDVWDEIKQTELDEEQRNRLTQFFNLQAKSENTPYQYYDHNVIEEVSEIKINLGLRPGAKLISLFPNVEWDSTAMGLDGPYKSMNDWIFSMIDFIQKNPDYELVIRAHPGELKVPYIMRTTTPICDVIEKKITNLPSNLHLIRADENISSYSLAEISDVVMVYTSTLGIEFSLKGIRPWIVANPYYAKKGFTVDANSHEHIETLLKEDVPDKFLTDEEIELAKKLAYAVKFRRSFSYPLFNNNGKFSIDNYQDLFQGGDPVIENICQFINDKRSYMDIGPLKG